MVRTARRCGVGGFRIDVEVMGYQRPYLWVLDGVDAGELGLHDRNTQGVILHHDSGMWLAIAQSSSNTFAAWAMEPGADIPVSSRLRLQVLKAEKG